MANIRKLKEILERQGRGIEKLLDASGKRFEKAVETVRSCRGTVIVIGFGKSGAVGAKVAATLRSAGRRAAVINPVEAFHGEAACISADDVALVISSSGESDEIVRIIPWLKKKHVPVIAVTPYDRSSIARAADVLLKTLPPADPTDNYASYSTCLSALAMADLIALAIIYEQDIEHERAVGAHKDAGEAIYTIEDLLATRPNNPVVPHDMIFRDALIEMTSKGLGAISVVALDGTLAGIITDGDVRRLLQRSQGSLTQLFLKNVESVMTKSPKRISVGKTLPDAITMMENNAITVLPVVNADSAPVGMIHLHDLVQLGLQISPPWKTGKEPAPRKKAVPGKSRKK